MRLLAICCVSSEEWETMEGELSGSTISPWRKISGELRVVSTTVLVGRSTSLPASRKRATRDCFAAVVYFCQSFKL